MRVRITVGFKVLKNNLCLREVRGSPVSGLLVDPETHLLNLTLYVDSKFFSFCLLINYMSMQEFFFLSFKSMHHFYLLLLAFSCGKTHS